MNSARSGAAADASASRRTAPLGDLIGVAAFKALVSVFVLSTGFRAISDDDYARVVIAERFAHAPHWDPSGTSWLPFPFWLNGSALALFGRSLEVARATAFALGVVSAALVYVAARWLGARRLGALSGALIACALPYAAWLGVATVPDGPTAALIVVGAAAACSELPTRRLLGALALAAACLSRYEAWPVAAAFSLFMLWDAIRGHAPRVSGITALIAAAGPLGWMLHGALARGSAFFFVRRVVAYRRALGTGARPLGVLLLHYPLAVLRAEPEIAGLSLLLLGFAVTLQLRALVGRYRRFALLLAALVAFLVIGDLRGGSPTQHPERVLLSVWLGAALFSGDALFTLWPALRARGRALLVGTALATLGLAIGWARPRFGQRQPFANRSSEIAIGRAARRHCTGRGRLLIDTPDYGFFATMAAFGQPERAAPFDGHDPRQARPSDAFASRAALNARLRSARARWLVAHGAHRALARRVGAVRAQEGSFDLVEVLP